MSSILDWRGSSTSSSGIPSLGGLRIASRVATARIADAVDGAERSDGRYGVGSSTGKPVGSCPGMGSKSGIPVAQRSLINFISSGDSELPQSSPSNAIAEELLFLYFLSRFPADLAGRREIEH